MDTVQNNPRMGFRDGMPIGLGYLAISFAFGITATSSGLSILEALLISMTNLTSAGQLAAVPIITSGVRYIELALTELIINLRYSLMSISISQRLDKKIRLHERFLLAFTLTDEIFAVSIGKQQPLGKKYMFSLLVLPYLGWSPGTLLGAIAGNILPEIIVSALGIAMYAMFIAIFVPAARDSRPVLFVVLIAVALSALFYYTPILNQLSAGFVIIICAIAASVIMAIIRPIDEPDKAKEEVMSE